MTRAEASQWAAVIDTNYAPPCRNDFEMFGDTESALMLRVGEPQNYARGSIAVSDI